MEISLNKTLTFDEFIYSIKSIFASFVIILNSGAFIEFISIGEDQGGVLVQLLHISVYGICFLSLLKKPKSLFSQIKKEKINSTLVFLAFLSFLWSVNPFSTLSKSVALLGTTLIGVFLANNFSWKQLLSLLSNCLITLLIFSLLFIFLLPQYGLDVAPHEGVWKGVFAQKNILARMMVLSVLVYYSNIKLFPNRVSFIKNTLLIIISIWVIIESHSTTSLILIAIIFCALPIIHAWNKYKPSYWVIVVSILIILIFVLFLVNIYSHQIVLYFGKDVTLSGRTILWTLSIIEILDSPFLGYGYNVFWENNLGPSAAIFRRLGWDPNHAHNGLLELSLGLGVPTATLFCIKYFKELNSNIRKALKNNDLPVFALVFLILFFFINISQSHILARNNLYWIIFLYVCFSQHVKTVNPNAKSINL